MRRILLALAVIAAPVRADVPVEAVQVIATFPHDPAAFTQGLIVEGGTVIESTGRFGQSDIRRNDLKSGKVLARTRLPDTLFGEGMTRWKDELVSVTWQSGTGFRWSAATLKRKRTFTYAGEGWGLTADGRSLILSDGTAELRYYEPRRFALQKRLKVTYEGKPLTRLNELEMVNGEIWANIWMTPFIARIDPADGKVTGVMDLSALVAENKGADADAVANGIAWDARAGRVFVTGKLWPNLYEIRLPEGMKRAQ